MGIDSVELVCRQIRKTTHRNVTDCACEVASSTKNLAKWANLATKRNGGAQHELNSILDTKTAIMVDKILE